MRSKVHQTWAKPSPSPPLSFYTWHLFFINWCSWPWLYPDALSAEKPPTKAYSARSYFFILASRNEIQAHGALPEWPPDFWCFFLKLKADRLTWRCRSPTGKSWEGALRLTAASIPDLILNLQVLNAIGHFLDAIFRFLISVCRFQNQKDLLL